MYDVWSLLITFIYLKLSNLTCQTLKQYLISTKTKTQESNYTFEPSTCNKV